MVSGIPIYILPLVVAIEIISFLTRPLSPACVFANMLAGHITLKVFAGFVALLGTSLGAIGWIGGILPLALTVALTALELLVAFLQAYVFAILTCIYLNDAIHPGH
jgi:F-type H+-transporting ATPase subunit a